MRDEKRPEDNQKAAAQEAIKAQRSGSSEKKALKGGQASGIPDGNVEGTGNATRPVFKAGSRLDRPAPGFWGELRYWLYYTSWIAARVVFYALFGLRVSGKNHVPKSGGFIIASNHQSLLDPIIVGIAAGPTRQTHYMARRTLFFPPFSWLIRLYNAFPIERGGADFEALDAAAARVRAGLPVLIFPEGTRTSNGRLQKLRSGAARLALATGAPVVPCYIHGSFRAWPRGKKFFRPIRGMRVMLGEPIMPEGKVDSKRERDAFTERLRNALAAMEVQAYSSVRSLADGTQSK